MCRKIVRTRPEPAAAPALAAIVYGVCVEGAPGNDRAGVLFSQPDKRWVDSGIKKYTINGVKARVLKNTRLNSPNSPNNGPNSRLNSSETGKNASQIATACFQRGGR